MFGALIHLHCFTSAGFYKTARSLDTGQEGEPGSNFQLGLGAGGELPSSQPVAFLDGTFRVALIPRLLELNVELSGSSALSFDFSAGLKYTFLQSDDFAMALYMDVADTTNIFSAAGYSFFSLQPALLATWNFSDDFSVTLAPRAYIPLGPVTTGTNPGLPQGDVYHGITSTVFGATLVFDIGKEFGVLPEVGFFYENSGGALLWHAGVGFRFG